MLVKQVTTSGYILELEGEEYFLHQDETNGKLTTGQQVEAFLFYDSQKRLMATMKEALVTAEEFGWAEVASVRQGLGIFINIGLSKEILIAPSDLPVFEDLWPQTGDRVYCYLKESQSNYLFGVIAKPAEFGGIQTDAPKSLNGQKISARVIRTGKIGTNIITEEGYMGFIHESERKEEPRLGSLVEGRVVRVKDDGEINMSLLLQKEFAITEDAQVVLAYLETSGGSMPLGDKSSPEEIKKTFKLSKSAFKRALGGLMKEGKVYQKEGWTYLHPVEEEDN